jgi:ribonuclease Z
LKKSINEMFDNWIVNFISTDDLQEKNIWDFKLKPLNLYSKKMEQFGFLLENKWKKILFFGDEAFNVMDREDLDELSWVDYLICEWLLPESMTIKWWGKFDIDKTHHITAKQAWRIAKKLNAKNLVIVHTKEIENRQELLKNDAQEVFSGNVFVPNDWDILEIL